MPYKIMETTVTGRLMVRYLLILGLFALLTWVSHFFFSTYGKSHEFGHATINLSGRQRMLSQRIALLASSLILTRKEAVHQQFRMELTTAIGRMEKTHEGLLKGDVALRLPGSPSPAIHTIYFKPPLLLDAKIRRYWQEAKALLEMPPAKLSADDSHLKYLQEATLGDLLPTLDAVTNQYQQEYEQKVMTVEWIGNFVLAGILLISLCLACWMFWPVVHRLDEEIASVQSLSQKLLVLNNALEERVAERTKVAEDRAQALCQSEANLRRQSTLLQSILDSMAEGVIGTDCNGQSLFFNPAAERILGMELTDAPLSEWAAHYGFFYPNTPTMIQAEEFPLTRIFKNEQINNFVMEIRNPKIPQGVLVSVSGRPLKEGTAGIRGGVIVLRMIFSDKKPR